MGGGFLTLTEPWPGMLRTIYGDDERYRETYWSRFPGRYFAGDGAKLRRATATGGSWAAWMTCSTWRATASARWKSRARWWITPPWPRPPWWARHHELKGQAIAAFVTLKDGHAASRGARGRPEGPRGEEDRGHRQARRHPLHRRPAEDPQREDHAPAARGHRGGTGAGRHHDAGGSGVVARLRETYEAEESAELERFCDPARPPAWAAAGRTPWLDCALRAINSNSFLRQRGMPGYASPTPLAGHDDEEAPRASAPASPSARLTNRVSRPR